MKATRKIRRKMHSIKNIWWEIISGRKKKENEHHHTRNKKGKNKQEDETYDKLILLLFPLFYLFVSLFVHVFMFSFIPIPCSLFSLFVFLPIYIHTFYIKNIWFFTFSSCLLPSRLDLLKLFSFIFLFIFFFLFLVWWCSLFSFFPLLFLTVYS